MTKYARSIQKLITKLRIVLDQDGLTDDTKAIVLLLAATLSHDQFYNFIDHIEQLDCINVSCKEINFLRENLGDDMRDLIIAFVLKNVTTDICSDELQKFINSNKSTLTEELTSLEPAFHNTILNKYAKRNKNKW